MTFPRLRWFFVTLTFVVLPMALFWSEFDRSLNSESDRLRLIEQRNLECLIWEMKPVDTPFDHFSAFLFDRINEEIRNSDSAANFKRWSGALRNRYPGIFTFIALDKDGRPIQDVSDIFAPPELLQNFDRDFRDYESGSPERLLAHAPRYRSFFGPLFGQNKSISNQTRYFQVSYNDSHSFLFVSPTCEMGRFLVFLNRTTDYMQLGWKAWLEDMRWQHPIYRFAFVDLHKPARESRLLLGSAWRSLDKALVRLGMSSGVTISIDNRLWVQMPVSSRYRILIVRDDRSTGWGKTTRQRVGMMIALLFICGTWISRLALDGRIALLRSIRMRLLFLLFYAVGLPLLLFGLSSRSLVDERKAVRVGDLYSFQESLLRKFDGGYLKYLANAEQKITQYFQRPLSADATFEDVMKQRILDVWQKTSPSFCELLNEHGNRVLRIPSSWEAFSRMMNVMLRGGTTKLMAELNGSTVSPVADVSGQMAGATAEMFGIDADFTMALFTKHLNVLREFRLADFRLQLLIIPIRDSSHHVRLLAMIGWDGRTLESKYIKSSLSSFSREHGNILLHARGKSDESKMYSPGFKSASFSAVIYKHRHRLVEQSVPIHHQFESNGKTWLMTGMQPGLLTKFYLWAFSPDDELRFASKAEYGRFAVLSMLLMIVGATVGRWLTSGFLVPARHLSDGVDALRRRDFNWRIPVVVPDEIGRLAATFNSMFEGLADLEVARIVQDTFFPNDKLVIGSPEIFGSAISNYRVGSDSFALPLGNWEIFGSCRSASSVGGDYFDYFPLPDGKIGIVIGDVSGHGISAAIVVAMAKALIAHPLCEFDPVRVLSVMQAVLLNTLQRKKMMTCFCAIFDPDTGILRFANAGHNYPYLLSEGKLQELSVPGFPLGTKSARNFTQKEVTISPADTLILYTDGFIEAMDTRGQMLGYSRVTAVLPTIQASDAVGFEHALREWHGNVAPKNPPDDDTTLVILKRRIFA
ncbi:MAG: SpoIIE family protein phosphatase [Candidatus Riflebacteria bacterium]|nr:SpoIIE family protein phosphatase [Candidatus Riflebacteria bacterium]